MKLQAQKMMKSNGLLGFVKCSLTNKVFIPSNSSMVVDGTLSRQVPDSCRLGLVQPLSKPVLPDGVTITPTLLTLDHGSLDCISVQVCNLTTGPIVIAPHSVLCQIQSCEIEMDLTSEHGSTTNFDNSILDQIKLGNSILTSDQKLIVQHLVSEYSDVFSLNDLDVGFTGLVKHQIILDNARPFKQRHRRIPPSMYSEVRNHLKQLLDSSIIRKSQSPWASNIVLVRKKDKSLRLCVDYRQLNERTIKDAYALPRIEELLDNLGGNSFYSVLDMKSGYHQVGIEEDSKALTAFTVGPLGLFEYNRLPFGLSNAPATYQRLMEECIEGIHDGDEQFCQIYLDDVIVASKSFDQHLEHLRRVFDRFRQAQMKLSPKKCFLFQDKVCYVGHTVSADGIEANQDTVDKIRDWPTPQDVNELRTYLGFTGYYRRFVKDYATIARPLNDLLTGPNSKKKKGQRPKPVPWLWTEVQQQAFEKLKECLTSPPVLGYPDFGKPFILHTDASCQGLGAVLYQEIDGRERVISYASRGLSKSERNYPAHKLEFLALKWAVTSKFHDYLYGNEFVVFTDNNPLTYVLSSAKLDATGHRWIAALGNYNFKIRYRSGKLNADADGLSRMPGLRSALDSDDFKEMSQQIIKALCQQHDCRYVDTICMSTDVLNDIDLINDASSINWRQHQMDDATIRCFLRGVTNKEKPELSSTSTNESKTLCKEFDRLVVRRGVLYRHINEDGEGKYQLVLPKQFRSIALQGAHNDVGHLGRDRGIHILRDRFYWPRMNTDLEEWIHNCDRCIKRKTSTNIRAPLVSITTSQPLELVSMDYLTLEMGKGGFQHILLITDHFTKYAVAIPTKNQTARTTADCLFNGFIVHYGFPKRLHSDQGANFQSSIIKELCKLTGMQKSRTTPYHPMGNGVTERMNRTLLNMLGTLDPSKKHDWKSEVSPLVHAYNCTRHDTTGYSPYFLMFGRQPRLALDVVLGLASTDIHHKDYNKYIGKLKQNLEKSYELASTSAMTAQKRQKGQYDKRLRGAVVEPGDRVLVKIVAFDGKHKIADRWEDDAYTVLQQPSANIPVYVVQKENGTGPKRTLHRNLVLPINFLPVDKSKVAPPIQPRRNNKTSAEDKQHVTPHQDPDEDELSDDSDALVTLQPDDDHHHDHPDAAVHLSNSSSDETDSDNDGNSTSDSAPTEASSEVSDEIPSPVARRPVPAPRRSTRTRHKPQWMSTDEYSMAQVATSETVRNPVQEFATGYNHVMSQLVDLLQQHS
jgi:transposase InsO family protein